jgi:hypothetical protein
MGMGKFKVIIRQLGGILTLLFSLGIAGFLFFSISMVNIATDKENILDDQRLTLVCLGLWFLVIGLIVSSGLVNLFPTIWVGEEGLKVSVFIFFHIKIPWKDITEIRKIPIYRSYVLVLAKHITPFHLIFGFMYSHKFSPAFLLSKDIKDYDLLISILEQNIRNNQTKKI